MVQVFNYCNTPQWDTCTKAADPQYPSL